MSEQNEELLQQYKSSLDDLRVNSRPMIQMLTMLADENKHVAATGIVKLIENEIWSVSTERKLIYLYLVDSICKNVNVYIPLFAKNLVINFCHVFESGDEKIRKNLHKLKETWKPYFSQQLLRHLDLEVHKLDPAWPVAAAKEADEKPGQMHINPKFIKKIDETNKLIESGQSSNAKLELERLNIKKRLLVEQSPSPERKRRSPNLWNNLVPSSAPIASGATNNLSNSLANPIINHSNSTGFASSIPGLGSLDTPVNLSAANQLSISNDISTSISSIQQPSSVVQQQPIMSTIQRASIIQPNPTNVLNHLENIPGLSFLSNHSAPVPSALNPSLHLNALNSLNSLANINQNRDVDYRINNEFSNPMFNLINNQAPAFAPAQQQPVVQQQQQPPPNLMSLGPAELKLQVDGAVRKLYYLDDHTAIVLMNCLVDLPFEELRRCKPEDLAPRLICFEGPPVNVYIDDRYTILLAFNDQWKTFYHLGIEQRIRFGGPAKEICLNNQTIQAKFGGDPVPCELIGDSLTHILRLGQPAPKVKLSDQLREDLWLALLKKYPISHTNNTLNNINLNNNINNLNSNSISNLNAIQPAFPVMQAPIVSIAPQPLIMHPVSSVINPALAQPNPQVIQPAAIIPSQPTNLPQQFIQPPSSFAGANSFFSGGLLTGKEQQKPSKQSQHQKSIKEKHQNSKEHQKHGESANYGKSDKRTKKQKAAAAAKEPYLELKPESLKIKRQSLIDSLYSGRQCTNCSLRFDNRTEKGKATYSAHLDWHFRQNRRVRDNSFKTSHLNRDWYLPLDLWLKYKEINMADDNDRMQNGQFVESGIGQMPNEADQEAVALPLLIKAFGDKELNKCAFCGDYFNEKWVDGVDEWRLENAIYGKDENGEEVVCHPTCLSDKLNKSIEDEATMRSEETILRISESMLESYDPTAEKEIDTKNENILSSINSEMESEETPNAEADKSQAEQPVSGFGTDDERMTDVELNKESDPLLNNDKLDDRIKEKRSTPEKELSDDSSSHLNGNGRLSQSPKQEIEADLKVEIIGLAMSDVMDESIESNERERSPEDEQPVMKIELAQTAARKPISLKLNMKSSNLDLVTVNNKRKAEKEANSPKSENSKSPVNYLEQIARDENTFYRGKEESALCSIM